MRQITLSIPDEVYEACEQIAKRTGRPVELCVMEFLTRHSPYTKPEPSEEQIREAMEMIRPYIGVIDTTSCWIVPLRKEGGQDLLTLRRRKLCTDAKSLYQRSTKN